jgi:hypothetical protein
MFELLIILALYYVIGVQGLILLGLIGIISCIIFGVAR